MPPISIIWHIGLLIVLVFCAFVRKPATNYRIGYDGNVHFNRPAFSHRLVDVGLIIATLWILGGLKVWKFL